MSDLARTMDCDLSLQIESLVLSLASNDPVERGQSRLALVEIGDPAADAVMATLGNRDAHVRWEAVMTLRDIADPATAFSLVKTLDDEDTDVRWVTGEALIALGSDALEPLLSGLIEEEAAGWLYEGAHHVIYELSKTRIRPSLSSLLNAFAVSQPAVAVPVAAAKTLRRLKASS